MNDQPMRDMVPPEEDDPRSIRRVQLNKNNGNEKPREVPVTEEAETEPKMNRESIRRENMYTSRRRGMHKGWYAVIGAVLVVFIFLSLTPIFAGAKIEVTPKHQDVEIDGQYSAAPQGTEAESEIEYQEASFEVVEEVSVPATGEEEVNRKASGRIRVYNEYGEEAERLIANTRFETENGLIYRVQNAITVPGYVEQGGSIAPGTLEVTVYAEEPGAEYNIQSAEFTIPGLAGDPRFEKMHAETITPIAGGFSGIAKVAEEEDILSAQEKARESLRTKVIEKARSDTPEDFVLLEDTFDVTFESLPQESGDEEVIVKERAIGKAALISKSNLASLIARETIGTYEGEDVRIEDVSLLEISVAEENDTVGEALIIDISGSPKIIWVVDYEALEEDLYGTSKGEATEILSSYEAIQEARIKINPFWKRTVPSEADKVLVEEVLE